MSVTSATHINFAAMPARLWSSTNRSSVVS
jgi:hypothetical protein